MTAFRSLLVAVALTLGAPVLAADPPAPPAPAPAATTKPKPAPPSRGRLMLVTGLIVGLLVMAKPAVGWLADAMSNLGGDPTVTPDGKRKAPDRLRPFRQQARDELSAGKGDAAVWSKALAENNGDETAARSSYIEARAQALYRAELDRRWAAAKAQSGGVIPPRR